MDDSISKFVAAVRAALGQAPFSCTLHIRGSSVQCACEVGSPPARRDIHDVLPRKQAMLPFDVVEALKPLKDARGLPPAGLDLRFQQAGPVDREVLYPRLDFHDVAELKEPGSYGLPEYAFINLRPAVTATMKDHDVAGMVPRHIEQARAILGFDSDIAYTQSICHPFYLMMINCRATGEIGNGGFNQMFEDFARMPVTVIVDMHTSFTMLEDPALTRIIDEAFQLYAHVHERVDEARQELRLPAAPRADRSDIQARYRALEPSVETSRARYIRAHPEQFTQVLVPVA